VRLTVRVAFSTLRLIDQLIRETHLRDLSLINGCGCEVELRMSSFDSRRCLPDRFSPRWCRSLENDIYAQASSVRPDEYGLALANLRARGSVL
jgi:hypothetical protein